MEKKTTDSIITEVIIEKKTTDTILMYVNLILAFLLGVSTQFRIGTLEITHVLNCNDVPGICKDKIKTFTVKETIKQ